MSQNTVALCMIVKDEAENLPGCLASVQGLADEVWVVDTGSQDETPDLARRLGANVLQFAWGDDFSAARNFGIDRAGSDWILILDADEQLTDESRRLIRDALTQASTEQVAAFILPVCSLLGQDASGNEMNYNVRLFRNRPEHRYRGAIHEQIVPAIREYSADQSIVELPATVMHYGYLPEEVERKQKPARNLAILERALERDPGDWHLKYHVAVCLYNLERLDEAAVQLTAILEGGPLQANYVARCAKILAVTLRRLGRRDEALNMLDRFQPNWPRFTDLEYVRAQLYRDQGDLSRALASAIRCRLLGEAPPPFDTHTGVGSFGASRMVGELAEQLGNSALAEQAYGEIPAGNPAFRADSARWLRLLAKRLGEWPAVMELVRRLPLPLNHALAADICSLAGLYQQAAQFIDQAKDVSQGAKALFKGRCLFKGGKVAAAVDSLRAVGQADPERSQADLWLAHAGLALESQPLLDELWLGWGSEQPAHQSLLELIAYLIGASELAPPKTELLLPLLRSVAPCVSQSSLRRAVDYAACSGFDRWLELAGLLWYGFRQPELAEIAYSHRQSSADDPRLEAALHQAQGQPELALLAYLRLLPHAQASVDDFLQTARVCRQLMVQARSEGGERSAD